MNTFALQTVCELVDEEMGMLAKVMTSPLDNHVSEESLLGIHWKELASEVSKAAPTTWLLFCHATCGSTEAKLKNYEPVCNRRLNLFMTD